MRSTPRSNTACGWPSACCWRGTARSASPRFKQQLQLTDGNLGAQLRRLEDDGYIALRRDFVERKPVTWYRLTAAGRKAVDRHLKALQAVIASAQV